MLIESGHASEVKCWVTKLDKQMDCVQSVEDEVENRHPTGLTL